jgi:hypothetical protein
MHRILVKSLVLVALLLALISCSDEFTPAPPMLTPTLIPSFTPTGTVTPTATATLTPPASPTATITFTPTPHPAQVFAEPILAVIAKVKPHFADDFSKIRDWSWDKRQADQVQIADGVMKVNGKGGQGIFPPHNLLNSRNFVFEFDMRLLNNSTFIGTFFRQQSPEIFYGFLIDGNAQWHFVTAATADAWRELPPGRENIRPLGEVNHIVIIVRDDELAVYLNGLPTIYLKDETFLQAGNLMPTFIGQEGGNAQGEFDNFKFWDLDKVKGLP